MVQMAGYTNDDDYDSGGFSRKLLILLNVLFIFFGAGIMAVGLWMIVDKKMIIKELLGSSLFEVSLYIVFGMGIFIIFVAFIGLLGAITKNRCLLVCYFIVLAIVFLILFIGGILGVVLKDAVKSTMREKMTSTLKDDYNRSHVVTNAWDWAQKFLNCCAVENTGWLLYQQSYWFNHTQKYLEQKTPTELLYVPESCCRVDENGYIWKKDTCQNSASGPPRVQSGAKNDYVYYEGCYQNGLNYIARISWGLFGVGFGVALSLICGLILTCCTYRNLKEDEANY